MAKATLPAPDAPDYASYLVRLWREEELSTHEWASEVQHIQSGGRWRFTTMAELLHFLSGHCDVDGEFSGNQR